MLESYLLKTGDILASAVVAEYKPDEDAASDADASARGRPSNRLPPRSSIFRNSSSGLLHFAIQPHAPLSRNGSRSLPQGFKKCIKHLQATVLSGEEAGSNKNVTFDDALDMYERLYKDPPLEDNPVFHEDCSRIRFSEQGFHRVIVYVAARRSCVRNIFVSGLESVVTLRGSDGCVSHEGSPCHRKMVLVLLTRACTS